MERFDRTPSTEWSPPISSRVDAIELNSRKQVGLRHIMILVVYFSIVFALSRLASQATETSYYSLLFGVFVLIGLGSCVLGLWLAHRFPSFSWVGWTGFVVGYMMILGSTISIFAIPSLPLLVGTIVALSYRKRTTNQEAMLGVLTIAAEAKVPLAPGVQAFASQSSGMSEIWAASLARLLRRGMSLPEAIDLVPRVVPRDSAILIRMGWESGKLAAGLHEANEVRGRQSLALRSFGARMAYLFWVVVTGQAIVAFVLYFIVPRFEAILRDFRVETPALTHLVIKTSHVIVDYGWYYALAQLAALILMGIVLSPAGVGSLPFLDRLSKGRHVTLILRSLSVVIEAGRPVGPALGSLARWFPSAWISHKLDTAATQTSDGLDWVEALRSTGLLSRSEAGVLESSRRVGNLPWALHELAETSERRWLTQIHVWSQIVFILAMLVIGGLVLVLAMAYFLPVVTLISRLSE